MPEEESLDLKIVLSLTNAYQTLMEEGRISPGQLDRVVALLDEYRDYQSGEFKTRMKEIFPDS